MTDRGMIMQDFSVRAMLENRKSQSRRPAWRFLPSPQPGGRVPTAALVLNEHRDSAGGGPLSVPTAAQRIKPGDRIWVREGFTFGSYNDVTEATRRKRKANGQNPIVYAEARERQQNYSRFRWFSPIHLPRFWSRLTLVVTAIRIEPVQKITEADAFAEGVVKVGDRDFQMGGCAATDAIGCYSALWWHLHGIGSWGDNPEVVVITFEPHLMNIDAFKAGKAAA